MSTPLPPEQEKRPELAKKEERVQKWRALTVFFVISYFVLATAILVWNAYTGAKTRETLVDCTTAGGECAQENSRQTAKVIDQLIAAGNLGDVATQQVVIYASACETQPNVQKEADLDKRVDLLLKCVEQQKDAATR